MLDHSASPSSSQGGNIWENVTVSPFKNVFFSPTMKMMDRQKEKTEKLDNYRNDDDDDDGIRYGLRHAT